MTRTERAIEWLVTWRWPLLALAIVLAVASWFPSRNISYDRSLENMFSSNDPILRPYRHFQEIFGEYQVLLAVYEDPDLLSPDGLNRLEEVSDRLREVEGVRDVLSLAEINQLVEGVNKPLGGLFARPASEPLILQDDSPLAQSYLGLFEGYTHSTDGRVAALACMIDPAALGDVKDPERQIVTDIRQVLRDLPGDLPEGMVAGEPVMVVDGFELVEHDGQRLSLWSTLLLSLALAFSFRSIRWLIVPLAVVQLTVVMTRATLALSGLQFTLVSSMLTALVTVVGVATVTHLIVRFYSERSQGKPPERAIIEAGTWLCWPIVGACVTDAIGFGSLWWSDVRPVYDFGTMMVVGSLLILPATALVVPALSLVGQPRKAELPNEDDSRLKRGLLRVAHLVATWPRTILLVMLLLGLFSIVGSLRLTVETDFTKNFRADSELVQSYKLIESRLGGAGVWDVLVPAPDVMDQAYLDRVLELESRLREIKLPAGEANETTPALSKVISLADAIEAGKSDARLALLPPEVRARGMAAAMPEFTKALQAKDEQGQSWLRIMLRSRERLPAEVKKQVVADVETEVAKAFPGSEDEPPGEVTGYHVLVIALVDSLVRDQWIMFALSCLGIAAMVGLAFRSPVLAAISLLPNALPVLMVTGLLGWLGIPMNMGAAMIAAVSMGLSVDSSIHYLTAFRREVAAGRSVREAIDIVQSGVGRAMFFSTFAIIVGFGVLCLSEFIPTVYFGSLASLTLLGGLVGNLVILPLFLLLIESPSRRKPTPRKRRSGL